MVGVVNTPKVQKKVLQTRGRQYTEIVKEEKKRNDSETLPGDLTKGIYISNEEHKNPKSDHYQYEDDFSDDDN